MIRISDRVNTLSPSATLAMSQLSNELKAKGIDVINMSVGEPDFNTPEFIKQAAKQAVDDNFSHYSPVAGYASLRRAVADKLLRENDLHYEPENIVIGNGAKQELCNVVLALINPGDEVIIPVPAWVSYVEMVKLAGGVPVTIYAGIEQHFKITPDQLEQAITDKTRLMMFNSPSNPTGAVYTNDELEALSGVLRRHPDIIVMADEIYEHICFTEPPRSFASFDGMKERTVIINGVSKAYAMTGWRIGYLAAPLEIAKAVSKLQGQYTSGASSIAQKAAEAAYTGPQDCVEQMRQSFERRRDLTVQLAGEVAEWKTNNPTGAFYLFPDVMGCLSKRTPEGELISTSSDYVMYLLQQAHVACVAGEAFCAPGYVRLSYATSEDNIRKALARITEANVRLI